MLVTERMQALGDHAKSSRQPPVKERRPSNGIESAAEQDVIDEIVLETGTAHESAAAVIVDDATSQIVVHENGNGAVAEITSSQDPNEIATAASIDVEVEPQPVTADDGATQKVRSRKTTTPPPQNAPSFMSGKTGRRYIRMSWAIRMSAEYFSGI